MFSSSSSFLLPFLAAFSSSISLKIEELGLQATMYILWSSARGLAKTLVKSSLARPPLQVQPLPTATDFRCTRKLPAHYPVCTSSLLCFSPALFFVVFFSFLFSFFVLFFLALLFLFFSLFFFRKRMNEAHRAKLKPSDTCNIVKDQSSKRVRSVDLFHFSGSSVRS